MLVQCTAGTDENQIRYGWNYAELLAKGPSEEALVPTPLYRAMQDGKLCRLEELTRMGSDVQDTLITVLSEKMMPIPELNSAVYAKRGFNVIATANNRDKGVNELSSALKRRFNVVVLPLPDDMDEEVSIVSKRVGEMAGGLDLPVPKNVGEEIARVLTIFRELRSGTTADGKVTLKTPSGSLSTAEAIATMVGGLSQAAWFDGGKLSRRRPGRQHRRRDRQGSGAGQGGAGGISGNGAEEAAGLRRLLHGAERRALIPMPKHRRHRLFRHPPPRARLRRQPGARRCDELRPVAVLIEGPADASALLPMLAARQCGRRWRCSAIRRTTRPRPASGRSPSSLPNIRRCSGRCATRRRCASSICLRRSGSPAEAIDAGKEDAAMPRRRDPEAAEASTAGDVDEEPPHHA